MKQSTQRITKSETIDPSRLSNTERIALGKKLYAVHKRVFTGVSEDRFTTDVIEPPAEKTIIRLYFGELDQLAGYCAVHTYKRRARGQNVLVLRAEAGLRPEYRGRGSTYWFGMVRAIFEKLRHPFVPVYFLDTLVHSSSYHLFCKYFPVVYPHPDGRRVPDLRETALELIESYSDPAVSEADPFVRDVGWITIESPQEKSLSKSQNYPDVRFFKERNPGYRLGHGLLVVVPITLSNLAAAISTRIVEVVSTHLGLVHPDL